ncbi:MAG: hypothetical protein QT00_C0001G0219 [archaeon GW2011_AR5]|nr:MAG: hypothetical protein QT00_C0001G0219 [archaeon GW2011_AR5]
MHDIPHSKTDSVLMKLKYPNRCPEYGTPEHYALGGGMGPIYEPLRCFEERIRRPEHE